MTPEDVPVITYTVPLFDRVGQVHGVIGVEISLEHIRKLLPANELSAQDSPVHGCRNAGEPAGAVCSGQEGRVPEQAFWG